MKKACAVTAHSPALALLAVTERPPPVDKNGSTARICTRNASGRRNQMQMGWFQIQSLTISRRVNFLRA
jgi:hypothetical protein